jgi:hypothetical protein
VGDGPVSTSPTQQPDVLVPTSRPEVPAPVTPPGMENPAGPIQAGTPVTAEGFSLVVKDGFDTYGDKIGVTVVVQNTGDRVRLFRYQYAAIVLQDDVGNAYRSAAEGKSSFYETIQFEVKPGEAVVLEPASSYNNKTYIPRFVGPISPQANKLIVSINGLGPFAGLEVEIDL